MKLIAFILFICFLYGAFATVRSLFVGFNRLFSSSNSMQEPAMDSLEASKQTCIDELKNLFGLYQSGALTKDEFEHVKRNMISKYYDA